MTEVRVSERSESDTGELVDGRSDAPMDVVMEMPTDVTPIAADTPSATISERKERNENGKCRMRSLGEPGDLLDPRGLEQPHGVRGSAASP